MEHDYEMDKKSGTKNQDHRGDIISHHNNHSVIEDAFETSWKCSVVCKMIKINRFRDPAFTYFNP